MTTPLRTMAVSTTGVTTLGATAPPPPAVGTTEFTWDRSDPIPKLLTQQLEGGERTYVIYGPGGHPYAQITGTDVVYYHRDQIGSTRLLTDDSGDPVGSFTYDPYGTLTASTGTVSPLLGFAGEYTDTETGFTYLRARYYDPTTGQFLTRDPLEHTTGDPYGYAAGNPSSYTDPTGLCPLCVPIVIGAASAAAANLVGQGLNNWSRGCGFFDDIDWGNVATDAAIGGVLNAGSYMAAARLARLTPSGTGLIDDVGDHVVLGKSIGLEDRAAKIGGRHLMGSADWQADVMAAISNPNTRISVALDGLEGAGSASSRVMGAVQRASSGRGSPLDWELMQLYQSGRLSTTTFYDGGRALTNPFG